MTKQKNSVMSIKEQLKELKRKELVISRIMPCNNSLLYQIETKKEELTFLVPRSNKTGEELTKDKILKEVNNSHFENINSVRFCSNCDLIHLTYCPKCAHKSINKLNRLKIEVFN